jgi:hypothetical protein
MRYLTRILPVTIVALVLPGPAWAARTVAPPGASGITQYLEVVPTAAGASPPGIGGGPGRGGNAGAGPQSGGVLTETQRHRLNGIGPDGRTLAAVVDATAPQQAGPASATAAASALERTGAPGEGASGPPGGQPLSSGSSASPASLVLDAVGGQGAGGLGAFLPAFMLLSALALAGTYVVRRRRMQ